MAKPTAAFKIVGVYIVVGCLWIVFSDQLLNHLFQDTLTPITRLQTLKGWVYVITTAALLYGLINRETKISRRTNTTLNVALNELRATQDALRHSEERFRVMVEESSDAMSIIDTTGTILYSSPNSGRFLGTPPSEMIGQSWGRDVHPNDVANATAGWRNLFEHPDDPVHTTVRMRHRDGSWRWIEGTARNLTDHPAIGGILTNWRDVTDRKQTEDLLRLREQQFRQAILNAPYPLILHAEDGEVMQINRVWTEITGYEAADIPTIADWTEKAYGRRMEAMQARIDQLYALNERIYEGEFAPQTKSGQQRIWEFSSAPIGQLPDGRRLVLSMAADITERKQAEMRLRAALAEKEVLLKEIHHRVKNNLQIVSGLLQLQAQTLNNDQAVSVLTESQHRIEAMSLIHKKLYTSSDLGQIDVADYIHSLVISLLTTYQVQPGRVAMEVDIEPVTLSLDQAIPCGLIINELVSNALKYAFPENGNGQINIKLCLINETFELTIEDNGIGLPAHLDWRNTQSFGLSLVHALATEQLDGSLGVERHPGTQFTIKFPHTNSL